MSKNIKARTRTGERRRVAAAIAGVALVLSGKMLGADHDTLISCARVMDRGADFDAIASIGIESGRIAAFAKDNVAGTELIGAKDLVVAPRSIDWHFRAVHRFAAKLALKDAVATGMDPGAGSLNISTLYPKQVGAEWQVDYGAAPDFDRCRLLVLDPESQGRSERRHERLGDFFEPLPELDRPRSSVKGGVG